MAVQRVEIPVSFQYLNTSGDLIPIPAGTALTILDRNTHSPAVLYAGFTGGTTITSPATDSGGNVPGYVVEGSYSITAAANTGATPPFAGATINWEAVRGDGVENIYPGAVTSAAIANGAVELAALAAAVLEALCPTGSITDYAGSTPPAGWHFCDGSVQSQTGTFANLYAVVGSTYNTGGEGAGNFRLPNLVGRFRLGKSAASPYNTLGATGGALDHVHGLGTPALTVDLGTPSVTVDVPGLAVPPHDHNLSNLGGAQARAQAGTVLFGSAPAIYVLSGAEGPNFPSSGWATLSVPGGSAENIGNSTFFGTQSSYALIGTTDNSAEFDTLGSTAGGNLNSGQEATGNINSGQDTLGADPAYIVLNPIIKL